MPTYQYRCQACTQDLEIFQKFSDPSLTECPECGGSLKKVFNAVGVVFKGSGFYATDSRKSPSASSAPKSTETSPTSSGSSSTEASSPSSGEKKAS